MSYGIPKSEINLKSIMDWPSQGGTLAELNSILNELPKSSSHTIATIGLNIGGDTSEDPNERDFGTVTAFIHVLDSAKIQSQLSLREWDHVINIDTEGREVGVHPLNHPESWLVVLPEWKSNSHAK